MCIQIDTYIYMCTYIHIYIYRYTPALLLSEFPPTHPPSPSSSPSLSPCKGGIRAKSDAQFVGNPRFASVANPSSRATTRS